MKKYGVYILAVLFLSVFPAVFEKLFSIVEYSKLRSLRMVMPPSYGYTCKNKKLTLTILEMSKILRKYIMVVHKSLKSKGLVGIIEGFTKHSKLQI